MKHEDAAWREDSHELRDVSPHETRRDVLKHEAAVHEIERTGGEPPEMWLPIYLELATLGNPVPLACASDHRLGDVDATNFVEIVRKRQGEAPRSTAEVEGAALREERREAVDTGHDQSDVCSTCLIKGFDVPTSFFVGWAQDRPQCIALSERILMMAQQP